MSEKKTEQGNRELLNEQTSAGQKDVNEVSVVARAPMRIENICEVGGEILSTCGIRRKRLQSCQVHVHLFFAASHGGYTQAICDASLQLLT
jgi:hypothetical protein